MTIAASAAAAHQRAFRLAGVDPAWVIAGVASLSLLVVVLFNPLIFNDGDTSWHVAAGGWMLDHHQVPRVDPFSYTMAGRPWHAQEWGSELLMALAFRLGGWAGVTILFGVALAAVPLLMVPVLRQRLAPLSVALMLAMALACVAPNLWLRPHILVLPIIAAWTAEMVRAAERGRAPGAWTIALMVVWANMHGSYVFGFLVAGMAGLEALVGAPPRDRLGVAWRWGLFGAISLASVAVLSPQGPAGLLYPFQLMSLHSLAGIAEWRAIDFSKIGPFEISLGVTLFVCLWKGVKVPPIRLIFLLALLHMALQHNRHVVVLAIVAPLLLAAPVAAVLSPAGVVPDRRPIWSFAGLAILAAGVMLIGLRAAWPLARPQSTSTPIAALDHTPAGLRARPVLNDYEFGGYLIFKGVRPFVDGRNDLYGDAFMDRYARIIDGDAGVLADTLKRYHIAWTLTAPNTQQTTALDRLPGWRRLYADRYAVVHVRAAAS